MDSSLTKFLVYVYPAASISLALANRDPPVPAEGLEFGAIYGVLRTP